MKTVFFLVTFAASFAFACMGGHLQSLAVKKGKKDVEWAQIDMVSSTIKSSKGSKIVEVLWQASNAEAMEVVCGTRMDGKACSTDVGLDYKLLENPKGQLFVTITQGKKVQKFKTTNFYQARDIGAACTTVYPEKK